MGGRGSSGGGGGPEKIAEFNPPEMKSGSEKQMKWARDIISGPHKDLISQADVQKRFVDSLEKRGIKSSDRHKELSAIAAAANRYKKEIANLEKQATGRLNDAKWVIDHRDIFGHAARQLLNEEKKKRKLT